MKIFKEKKKDSVCIIILFMMCLLFFHAQSNIFHSLTTAGDGLVHSVPCKIFSSKTLLWNPYVTCGTYTLKDSGSQALYLPALIIMKIFPNIFGYNLCMLLHYWAAGCFTYLYLRKIQIYRTPAMCGSIAFIFSGFMIAHGGHYNMIMAAVYLPIILYFLESYFSNQRFIFLFYASVSFALSISADYLAVSMYIGMLVFPYIIARCYSQKNQQGKKHINIIQEIIFISCIIFGGGVILSAFYWIPVLQSFSYINRSELTLDQFKQFSLPIYSLITLVIPNLFGNSTLSNLYRTPYYGEWNASELAYYVGILTIIFAIFAIISHKKNRYILFFSLSSLAALVLAFGGNTPLADVLYHVPLYNMFRASCRLVYLADFSLAVLLSFGINTLMHTQQNTEIYRKYLDKIALVLIAVMFISIKYLSLLINWFEKFVSTNNLGQQPFGVYFLSVINGIKNQQFIDYASNNLKFSSNAILIPFFTLLIS